MAKTRKAEPKPDNDEFVLTLAEIAEREAQIDAARLVARGQLARALDDQEGFGHFFWCITGHELPPYAKEQWIPAIWDAKKHETGILLEAFRGSTKSTVLSAFCLFRIGHNPEKSGLIVMSNDDASNKMSAYMAAIVEYSKGWQAVFPHVTPDKERGWGAQGYFVYNTQIEHSEWVEKTLKDHQRDPSFVAAGIVSSDIVGMHPTNFLYIDDIHDEKNSISERERGNVINSLRKNLLPTMSRPGEKPFICFAYTPWVDGDAYQVMESTGVLRHMRTPLYTECPEGDDGAEWFDNKWVRFAWPDTFGKDYAEGQKALVKDNVTYALMYLLDREAAKRERIFKYYAYPNERVNFGWPMQGGADYAGVIDQSRGKPGGRSHFALSYVAKTPEGYAVVCDGVVEQYSPAECDDAVIKAQGLFVGWLGCVIESDGKGEEFVFRLMGNPGLRITPMYTGGKGKDERLYSQMSKWFENGKIRVSDANTKFLNVLRSFLDNYPNLDRHAAEWDVADSVYWALRGMPEMFIVPKEAQAAILQRQRVRIENPFNSFGRH